MTEFQPFKQSFYKKNCPQTLALISDQAWT